ncbi:MAG TPA: hypothetical protein PLS95_10090 [Thermoanaerobaculales bacterium]|nr:hypothetical protein [Thermoanaerobaculales bacterium]
MQQGSYQNQAAKVWQQRTELLEATAYALQTLGQGAAAAHVRDAIAMPVQVEGMYYRLDGFQGFVRTVCHTCGDTDLTYDEARRRECRACYRDRVRDDDGPIQFCEECDE